jgi:hypothetical protein
MLFCTTVQQLKFDGALYVGFADCGVSKGVGVVAYAKALAVVHMQFEALTYILVQRNYHCK